MVHFLFQATGSQEGQAHASLRGSRALVMESCSGAHLLEHIFEVVDIGAVFLMMGHLE